MTFLLVIGLHVLLPATHRIFLKKIIYIGTWHQVFCALQLKNDTSAYNIINSKTPNFPYYLQFIAKSLIPIQDLRNPESRSVALVFVLMASIPEFTIMGICFLFVITMFPSYLIQGTMEESNIRYSRFATQTSFLFGPFLNHIPNCSVCLRTCCWSSRSLIQRPYLEKLRSHHLSSPHLV